MDEYIQVPKSWLVGLLWYVERTRESIEHLPPEEIATVLKIGTSELAGYASSAETILKYHETNTKQNTQTVG